MKLELAFVQDYVVAFDDSEIKVGDFITDKFRVWMWKDDCSLLGRKRVVGYRSLNGAPKLDDIHLLPTIGEDEEMLAFLYNPVKKLDAEFIRRAFVEGYKVCKRRFKYEESDMNAAMIEVASRISEALDAEENVDIKYDDVVRSVVEKKRPIAFECEMVEFEVDMGLGEECVEYGKYPKTETSFNDDTVLVGKYIYK